MSDTDLFGTVPYKLGGMALTKQQEHMMMAAAVLLVLVAIYYYGSKNPSSGVGKQLAKMGLIKSPATPLTAKKMASFRAY